MIEDRGTESELKEPSLTRIFGYDNADRLTTVNNGGSGESYGYDDVGNRTSSHLASSYGYQAGQFNRLVSAVTPSQTISYSYDPNGNMVRKAEGSNFWQYGWDHENRLTEAAARRDKVRYKYDALGRRVRRFLVGNREHTKFTYDGHDVLVDDDFGTLTKYLNGPGIDNKLRTTTGSTASYFLADHLGSTNGLADSTGAVTASNSYDSFGNPSNTSFPSRYQFTGREFDPTAKLQFSRARFYDPNLGRFISEDPIGFAGGDVNHYAYVWNNPQRYSDPYGLFPGPGYGNIPQGWGNDVADWWDARIDVAQDFWGGGDLPIAYTPGLGVTTFWGGLRGFGDMFRVGSGLGQAIYACDENAYGRAAFVAMDLARAAGIAGIVGGLGVRFAPRPASGLNFPGNDPTKAPSGYEWRGKPGSVPGSKDGNYYNPNTGESLRPDLGHKPPIGSHWDYRDPTGKWWRIYSDGSRFPK
jgi:RHS repeat-associated protein